MKIVVGLTGGIGSGKSTVAEAFARLGVDVTDTDRIAHALTAPGASGDEAIRAVFGSRFHQTDGRLDRAAMRKAVFDDPALRAKLEAALHPLIREASTRAIADWTGGYGVLVVPLLFERGGQLAKTVQRVLVVDCPEALQVARAMARSGHSETEVRAIMATQLSRADRLARADDVIDNTGPVSALAPKVAELDRLYRSLAGASAPKSARVP